MTPEIRIKLGQGLALIQEAALAVNPDTNEVVARQDHVEIITHFDDLRILVASFKEARDSMQEIVDRLSTQSIPDVMQAMKVKTITLVGVGRCTVAYRYSCSMIDKEAGYQWLRDTGNESLIAETVNSSSLSAFAKNLIETEGKELPEAIFKTGSMPYTSITKV